MPSWAMSNEFASEGVAVYLSVLRGVASGAGICFAIALHNIPEGVVVASPVYAASGRFLPFHAFHCFLSFCVHLALSFPV